MFYCSRHDEIVLIQIYCLFFFSLLSCNKRKQTRPNVPLRNGLEFKTKSRNTAGLTHKQHGIVPQYRESSRAQGFGIKFIFSNFPPSLCNLTKKGRIFLGETKKTFLLGWFIKNKPLNPFVFRSFAAPTQTACRQKLQRWHKLWRKHQKNNPMAKEFKRSGSKDFKGKKSFRPAKGNDNKYEKKSWHDRSADSPRPAEDSNRNSEREFKNDKPFESKKPRSDKRDNKPSFERFRDESRPSDFGSSKNRRTTGYTDSSKKSFSDKPAYKKRGSDGDEKPTFSRDKGDDKSRSFSKKPFADKPDFKKKRDEGYEKSFFKESGDDTPRSFSKKPFADKPDFKKKRDDGDEKTSFRDRGDDRPRSFSKKSFSDKPDFKKKREDAAEKPFFKDRGDDKSRSFSKKPFADKPDFVKKSRGVNPNDLDESDFEYGKEKPKYTSNSGRGFKKSTPYGRDEKKSFPRKKNPSKPQRETDDGLIRLNKYLSNAGICSRREADDLISSGVVQVNGKTITEMGHRVKPTDIIKYGGQTLKKERLVYFVLNKPKDYITTADDPQNRKTVLELIQGACKERVYPVGRLDRATTGLLMFTNDGELTKKLTHPKYGVRKIYHAELDKPLKRSDLDSIAEGLELEDGAIKVDEISYVGEGVDKTQVGVEIHSGKNRIVRRIFEHLGYNVRKLDRVMFGSLTKKDLPRGRWRILTEAEVGILKMISAG